MKTVFISTISTFHLQGFQSHHQHGGGAGACGAGVQPSFDACWWADTAKYCNTGI